MNTKGNPSKTMVPFYQRTYAKLELTHKFKAWILYKISQLYSIELHFSSLLPTLLKYGIYFSWRDQWFKTYEHRIWLLNFTFCISSLLKRYPGPLKLKPFFILGYYHTKASTLHWLHNLPRSYSHRYMKVKQVQSPWTP